jgi:predicted nucleic acid-binding protein
VGAVKVYFDSNVVIASLIRSHVHHEPALSALLSVRNRISEGFVSAHGLAESYVLLGRALYPDFLSPYDGWYSISSNVLPFFSIVSLSSEDYQSALERCARQGVFGGHVYDAVHIQAAIKANCDRLFTFNVKHFRQLAPADFADRVVLPS